MDTNPTAVPDPPGAPGALRRAWHSVRGRVLAGLLLVLPILLTFWVVYWLYSSLERYVIGPLAQLVIWKVGGGQPDAELSYWFETFAAPLIAVVIALLLLYCLGLFAQSRLRRAIDWALQRVPVISTLYGGAQKLLQSFDKPRGGQRPQRVVLVAFPHPGMRVPAFVTSTSRDIETGKVILCVYVPTTPVPTSGYMLLVPEEEVTELTWTTEQALQTIISGGLTAPPEVRYYKPGPAAEGQPPAGRVTGDHPARPLEGRSPST